MNDDRRLTTVEDGSTMAKGDPRMAAAAFCEDAAASIGLVIAYGAHLPGDQIQLLGGIENDLLDLVADINAPVSGSNDSAKVHIDQGYIHRLRFLTDHYRRQLDAPESTVIPGGTAGAALLHKARAAVRLAEVHACQAADAGSTPINPVAADYLDELSRLLLLLARHANVEHGDVIWQPGLSAKQAEEAEQVSSSGPDSGDSSVA